MQVLLAFGSDINAKESRFQRTSLMYGCMNGFSDCISVLLAHGADIEETAKDGATSLIIAASHGYVDCVRLLLAYHANITAKTNTNGKSALTLAALNGHDACMRVILRTAKRRSTLTDSELRLLLDQALINASMKGHCACVKLALAHGANVDAIDTTHRATSLILASRKGNADCVRVLLMHQASVNAKDGRGRTSMMSAVLHGHSTCLQLLLQQQALGADACLPVAVGHDRLACVKMLLENGADPDQTDELGSSVLYSAVAHRRVQCTELLLQYGADVNAGSGGTLARAIAADDTDIVRLLLKHHVDTSMVRMKENNSASIMMAQYRGLHVNGPIYSLLAAHQRYLTNWAVVSPLLKCMQIHHQHQLSSSSSSLPPLSPPVVAVAMVAATVSAPASPLLSPSLLQSPKSPSSRAPVLFTFAHSIDALLPNIRSYAGLNSKSPYEAGSSACVSLLSSSYARNVVYNTAGRQVPGDTVYGTRTSVHRQWRDNAAHKGNDNDPHPSSDSSLSPHSDCPPSTPPRYSSASASSSSLSSSASPSLLLSPPTPAMALPSRARRKHRRGKKRKRSRRWRFTVDED